MSRLYSLSLLQQQEPPPPGKVEVLTYAPGFEKARTDADLSQLYRDNLEPDLAPFKRSGGWSIQEFKDFVTVSGAACGLHGCVQQDQRQLRHWHKQPCSAS